MKKIVSLFLGFCFVISLMQFSAIAGDAPQVAPAGLIAVTPSTSTSNDGKIMGTTNKMEYKLSTATNYTKIYGTQVSNLVAGVYNVRYFADPAGGLAPGELTNVLIRRPADDTDFIFTDNGTDITINDYTGSSEEVIVPSVISGKAVAVIGENAFAGTATLKSVTLPGSVISIGENAFNACSSLVTAIIPSSVTSAASNAFSGCSALTIYGQQGAYIQTFATNNSISFSTGNVPQTAPTGLGGVTPSTTVSTDGKITGTTNLMEYKLSTDLVYTVASNNETIFLPSGTYSVRYAAQTGYNASASTEVVIPVNTNIDQASPTGISPVSPSAPDATDGKITGTTTNMEYKPASDTTYTPVTGEEITGLAVGKYNIRYKASSGYNAGPAIFITVKYMDPSAIRAFPGAEGFGAYATGGRGGDVYYVTNLNDSGAGSLRYGITSATGPRTIMFAVGGTINLAGSVSVSKPNITIAGQTAPGGGILLKGGALTVSDDDVVIRYVRVRNGVDNGSDSMGVSSGNRVIIDHCSVSWAADELLSVSGDGDVLSDVTVQWCFINEPLTTGHQYGSLVKSSKGTGITYHHNLYSSVGNRSPGAGNYTSSDIDPEGLYLDFRNNVIANPTTSCAGYTSTGVNFLISYNLVNNYYKAGTATPPTTSETFKFFDLRSTTEKAYIAGNTWNGQNVVQTAHLKGTGLAANPAILQPSEIFIPSYAAVETDTAGDAYTKVLSGAGASLIRDAVDTRLADEVAVGGGRVVDNNLVPSDWPTINGGTAPLDTDADGMPDNFEARFGLNAADSTDRNLTTISQDGYTNLEVYLNSIIDPIDNIDQAAPQGLTSVPPTNSISADGKIVGTTTDMEYKKDGGAIYTAVTGAEITGLTSGTYYVRYKAKQYYNAGADATVVVEQPAGYMVSGYVTDVGATISIGSNSVTSDATGFFRLNNVEAGTYNLIITKNCALTRTITITVSGDYEVSSVTNKIPALYLGDSDGNGSINVSDMSATKNIFGKNTATPGYVEAYDVDTNGSINVSDISLIKNNFGKTVNSYPVW